MLVCDFEFEFRALVLSLLVDFVDVLVVVVVDECVAALSDCACAIVRARVRVFMCGVSSQFRDTVESPPTGG